MENEEYGEGGGWRRKRMEEENVAGGEWRRRRIEEEKEDQGGGVV